jgi:hypothetical protein
MIILVTELNLINHGGLSLHFLKYIKVYHRDPFTGLISSQYFYKTPLVNFKLHLYADDTIMYTLALTVDLAVSKILSDFISMQESLADLKLVLNTVKTNAVYTLP